MILRETYRKATPREEGNFFYRVIALKLHKTYSNQRIREVRNELRSCIINQGIRSVFEGIYFPAELVTSEHGNIKVRDFQQSSKFITSVGGWTLPQGHPCFIVAHAPSRAAYEFVRHTAASFQPRGATCGADEC